MPMPPETCVFRKVATGAAETSRFPAWHRRACPRTVGYGSSIDEGPWRPVMAKAHRPDLRDALEEFRSTGHMSAAVRPEIAASWQRSIAFDLRPDRFEVPYVLEPPTDDDRLERAARPVMDRLVEDLGSASMGVILADRHGQIL